MPAVPTYLERYDQQYKENPKAAAVEWFKNTKYGLFLHYGLYSLLGEHEWVQYHRKIPPAEYAELQKHFTAENFDAEHIVAFAQDCGMSYINLTSRHHDGFCLFNSLQTTFTSVEAPAGRDLVGELADACQDAGLGLFLYYSHAYDWHHPHAPNREEWGDPARPAYDEMPGCYATEGHDLEIYLDFIKAQITELLENYGPIAGIWLDPSLLPQRDTERFADAFKLESLYETIRELQPQTLISYKEGVTETEDFVTPEHGALNEDAGKPGEICTTMVPGEEYRDEIGDLWGYGDDSKGQRKNMGTSWGYSKPAEGMHKSTDEVWNLLQRTGESEYNLLLNTAPLPNGSLDPDDEAVLREVGSRIRQSGFPDM